MRGTRRYGWPTVAAAARDSAAANLGGPWWFRPVALMAIAAAGAGLWVTLDAEFLANPGWLAAQKADFILGPVFVGLYWMRRRPESRFGPLLIAFGFLGALYVLQSSSNSWLFSIGLLAETAIGLATRVLILAFPTGRLDRPAKVVLAISVLVSPVPALVVQLISPQTGAGASISGCLEACPRNEFAITSNPALAASLTDVFRFGVILAACLTAALLIWRFVKGTPPQRRALAIGTPIALLFLAFQITFQLLAVLDASQSDFSEFVKWGVVAARAALWYGFLFALVAAELFAARALQRLLMRALRRPRHQELEAMLQEPLGDPTLRIVFRDARTGSWTRADGSCVGREPPAPAAGQAVTFVRHHGTPAVALLHDVQLDDDPELLRAAGSLAMLAAENANLDAAWHDALEELRSSRARIVRAGDQERRRLERNLHDGVQQRLIVLKIHADLTRELAGDTPLRDRLTQIAHQAEETLNEVREVAHGIHPPVLSDHGLVAALRRVHLHTARPLHVRADGIGRYPPDLESAVYYCCTEAVQNATKHGGAGVEVGIRLHEDGDTLAFEVADDGPGFEPSAVLGGSGLQNMRDRLGALGGHLTVDSAPGRGTIVSGGVPLEDRSNAARGGVDRRSPS
jgi:signal transduction histidine kinase